MMDIEQPSLYNCYFVESCQTSPSKRENQKFGIVISLFVSYLFAHGHPLRSQNLKVGENLKGNSLKLYYFHAFYTQTTDWDDAVTVTLHIFVTVSPLVVS